jgi:hypothetical protein
MGRRLLYEGQQMDNVASSSPPQTDHNRPIPVESDRPKPTGSPVNHAAAPAGVSRAPLNLGAAGKPAATPPTAPSAAPAMPKITTSTPVVKKLGTGAVSTDRITAVKTFFAKLHPGAIEFLDGQIAEWLKENPGISIKQTNVSTGDIQGKNTEANLIITIWY